MKKLYCAYGSNLNLKQMAARTTGANLVGVGKIFGYELVFRGISDSAYATIVEKEGSFVPVALYELSEDGIDEKRLDSCEGYPFLYEKRDITVDLGDRQVPAMVYVMEFKRATRAALPSQSYFARIWEGYEALGFDTEILKKALENTFKQFYYVDALNNRWSWTFFQ